MKYFYTMKNNIYIFPETEVVEKTIFEQICQTSLEAGFEEITEEEWI